MQFQSAEHERSYRLACKAVAYARREAYYTATAMTTADLRKCASEYVAEFGRPTDEALTQLRMVRTIIRLRTCSPRTRHRMAQQFNRARARMGR